MSASRLHMAPRIEGRAAAPHATTPYAGQPITLLTRHGKQRVIAPVLDAALGCQVRLESGFDTDLLGSFSREVPRAGTQLQAARTKARQGMALSGLPLGLASEGSFGRDPIVGMVPWNVEIVVFLDDQRGLEVLGVSQAKANVAHVLTDQWSEVEALARRSSFPQHQLVVGPQGNGDPRIRKGIAGWGELESAFAWARGASANGQVFVESDLRAHAHPTRMDNIRRATEDLAAKLASPCPACRTPGFWVVERLGGLPCADCTAPSSEMRAEVHGCLKCDHRLIRERTDRHGADPSHCDTCNP